MSPSHPTSNLPPFGRAGTADDYTDEQFKAVVLEKLAGGNRAFQDMRDKIDAANSQIAVVHKTLEPKRIEWGKVIGMTFTVLTAVITLVWTARGMVMERPTKHEVDTLLSEQRELIEDLELEVKGLRDQWVEHTAAIKEMQRQLEQRASRATQPGTSRGGASRTP